MARGFRACSRAARAMTATGLCSANRSKIWSRTMVPPPGRTAIFRCGDTLADVLLQLQSPGPGAYDRFAVAFDQVIKRDGVYYAFYHANAHDPWQKDWTTNVARSRDLIHWEKYPGNPI